MKAVVFCMLLLTGCAQMPAGVQMSDQDKTNCEASGCTVWTADELMQLIREVFRKGYQAGVKSI